MIPGETNTVQRVAIRALACLAVSLSVAGPASAAGGCPALLDHTVPRLQDEKPQDLCQYQGQVLLVVNTASRCGYTDQYGGLEALHDRYRARGLVVMGFPSNDFGGQEPGSNAQIADFCANQFGVQFPMFAKVHVKGAQAHPLYVGLAAASGGQAPGWNFHKYLIGRDGQSVRAFGSRVRPDDPGLIQAIEQALSAAKPAMTK